MSEIRETLVESIIAVKEGKMPIDTATTIHLLAHRHVMDAYATVKVAQNVSYEKAKELLGNIK